MATLSISHTRHIAHAAIPFALTKQHGVGRNALSLKFQQRSNGDNYISNASFGALTIAPPFALFISYIALRYYKGIPHVNPMPMGYRRTCSQTFMASADKEKGGQGDGGEDKYLPEKSSLPLDGAVTPASLLHGLIRPVLDCVPWIRSLSKTFGMQFLLLIFFGEHILRGFIDGSGSSGHGFLAIENLAYVQLKVGASAKSVLAAVAGSAWSLKPIFGMLSDVLVVAGYRWAPWVILTAVLGTLGFTGVFAFGQRLGPALLCLCFFFVHMQTAWTDLMVQTTYTEQMQKHPEQGSSIVTFVWVGIAIATMAGVLLVGPGLELYGPFRMAGLGIPAAAAMLVPACLGWFAERRRPSPKWGFDWDIVRRQKSLFTCTLILTMAVVMTSLFAMLGLPLVWQTAFSILWSGGVGLASMYLLPPTLWKPMLFLFLQSAMTINTYGFMDNFFLDAATRQQSLLTGYPMCKDCPHLDSTFYVTVVGLWDALFVLLGSWLFNDVMANWTYRRAIFASQVAMSAAMLLDAVQFERLNVRLGIPDPLFLILRHAVQNTSAMAHFIP
eukprot:EG_transcript_8388